jgi:predicted Fe-Mo cluster-binding NifX family protein
MLVAVPVQPDGSLDPRWGRAQRVAVADVHDAQVIGWTEHDVGWGDAHDLGSEGSHHARVARFLRDHGVDTVVAHHMGDGMQRMLGSMDIRVVLGAVGQARDAAASV